MELSTPRQWPGSSRSTAGSDRAAQWQGQGAVECVEAMVLGCRGGSLGSATLLLWPPPTHPPTHPSHPPPHPSHPPPHPPTHPSQPATRPPTPDTHPPGLSLSSFACMSWAYTGGLTTCRYANVLCGTVRSSRVGGGRGRVRTAASFHTVACLCGPAMRASGRQTAAAANRASSTTQGQHARPHTQACKHACQLTVSSLRAKISSSCSCAACQLGPSSCCSSARTCATTLQAGRQAGKATTWGG